MRINLGKNKALAFIVGLAYGYRNAHIEFKTLSLEEFVEENHKDDKVYYISRLEGEVYESFNDKVSHICVVREDKINGKVCIFIYKKHVK